ncbi:hypothetical protein SLE2022_399600 [Rubroshorea leprosula]
MWRTHRFLRITGWDSWLGFWVFQPYVVYLGEHTHGLEPTSLELNQVTTSHYKILSSVIGSAEIARDKIFYSYTHSINGFVTVLDEEEAVQLAKMGLFLPKQSGKRQGLGKTPSSQTLIPVFGRNQRAFRMKGMVPFHQGGAESVKVEMGDEFHCSRKLIGARYLNKGLAASVGDQLNSSLPPSLSTVRDLDGHGSHTLSTAAGNFVLGANVFGHGNETASGGSPAARVAAYKVCWPEVGDGACMDADILATFDAAISDGLDVLSLSIGGMPAEYFEDGIAIGSFHAVKNGITVVASAGNYGPTPGTMSNVAPWIFTIGASTVDSAFTSYITLGNKKKIEGMSLSATILLRGKYYPLITGASARLDDVSEVDANLCEIDSLDPRQAKGKIVVCFQGGNGKTENGVAAL